MGSHMEFCHDKTDEYLEEAKKPKMEKIENDKYEYNEDTKSKVGNINHEIYGASIKVEKEEIEGDIKPKLEDPSKLILEMIKVEKFEYFEEDIKPIVGEGTHQLNGSIIKVEKKEFNEKVVNLNLKDPPKLYIDIIK